MCCYDITTTQKQKLKWRQHQHYNSHNQTLELMLRCGYLAKMSYLRPRDEYRAKFRMIRAEVRWTCFVKGPSVGSWTHTPYMLILLLLDTNFILPPPLVTLLSHVVYQTAPLLTAKFTMLTKCFTPFIHTHESYGH